MRVIVKYSWDPEYNKILAAVAKATMTALKIAGFNIRKTAMDSLQAVRGASDPGTPPHTHTTRYSRRTGMMKRRRKFGFLPGSIIYSPEPEKQTVVIGPNAQKIDQIGHVMEFGGEYKGGHYPARPFMGPALTANLSKIPGGFAGQVTG